MMPVFFFQSLAGHPIVPRINNEVKRRSEGGVGRARDGGKTFTVRASDHFQ